LGKNAVPVGERGGINIKLGTGNKKRYAREKNASGNISLIHQKWQRVGAAKKNRWEKNPKGQHECFQTSKIPERNDGGGELSSRILRGQERIYIGNYSSTIRPEKKTVEKYLHFGRFKPFKEELDNRGDEFLVKR